MPLVLSIDTAVAAAGLAFAAGAGWQAAKWLVDRIATKIF